MKKGEPCFDILECLSGVNMARLSQEWRTKNLVFKYKKVDEKVILVLSVIATVVRCAVEPVHLCVNFNCAGFVSVTLRCAVKFLA